MVDISGRLYRWRKFFFDRLHVRKVSTFCPQIVMGGQQRGLVGSTSLPRALSLVQILSSSVPEKRLFLPSYSLINSLRNARDSDLMQIEDAFKDPEDRYWEKNSSEGIVGNPAMSKSSFFPYTLNQPRYFELVNSRVQEETPKRPTKSEVRQVIETLSRYSLFAVEGAEIRGQTSQLSFDRKSIRKNQKQQSAHRFFNARASAEVIRHIITLFLFNQCLSSNCAVFC